MENQIICPNCNEEYREDNIPRILVSCGHTFCQECLQSFINFDNDKKIIKCPDDKILTDISNKSLKKLPKNLALIRLMNAKNTSLHSFKVSSCDVSKITKKDDANNQDEDDADLISFINLQQENSKNSINGTQNNSEELVKNKKPLQECLLHKKPLDIVCTIDMVKICSSCAIFGDHKGHAFKSLEQVEKMRISYSNELLEVFDRKQQLMSQINSESTRDSLIGMVTDRKKLLKKQITQYFGRIIQKIEQKKVDTIRKLNVAANRSQNKIKQLLKFDKKLMSQYEIWEQKSYQQIKLLQETSQKLFIDKFKLLFQQVQGEGCSLLQGRSLLQSMTYKIDGLFDKVEDIIGTINISFNDKILNQIDNTAVISSEENILKIKQNKQVLKSQSKKQTCKEIADKNAIIVVYNQSVDPAKTDQNDDCLLDQQPRSQKIGSKHNESIMYIQEPVSRFSLDPKISFERIDESFEKAQKQNICQKNQNLLRTNLNKSPLNKNMNTSMIKSNIKGNKSDKISKKKLTSLKIPQKYQKVIEGLKSDMLQIVDFTNAELGDSTIHCISQYLPSTKVRNVKFIRNKLTDEGIVKILPYMSNIVTLNLSQNLLTQNVLDMLINSKEQLPHLRNIILSQNKINERKNRAKLENLKKLDWTVSL